MKFYQLILVFAVLSILSLFVGVQDLSAMDLFHLTKEESQTLFFSRFPRLLSIIMAGMSLSICGLIMQQITRNKFVSPTTAGTMDWARLGVLISLLVFASASPLLKMSIAFIFSLAGNLLFMRILDRIKFNDTIYIPLVGLMLGSIVSSLATFIAYKYDLIQNLSSWLQGDFSLVVKGRYELLYLSIPLLIIAYLYADKFTVAGMGESFSINLGVKYKQIVNIGLVIVSLITSITILTVGMLPFLGLIIPNIVSIYRGDHLRKSLPHTALLGAVFVLACDILGRVIIFPYEISIGLMVGVIGSAIFLFMLIRRGRYA
ncbi:MULTISPECIES: ABC transporter permease [Priestia]|uniref:ABC transporter permease n=5 Tax=Priestia TaxID=2800373 RepID=A0A2A8SYX6_PRIMG|nr:MULTISPECIES: ABC transporter permease [Priestia]AVX09179.1 iron ABC transporter permease [Bacillus sp. Y-01]KOP75311.1 iron ABC transporter permease [Bacillus sp. FJAT-21351]KQU16753.1 iron ABC transporter permease [Bacillus sp. Leaf75]KRF56611.1 iron ABC transporter permease [Bacillus sp. Soil531]MBZ5480607.1 ABC transporter permease [Bacillus sp. T_4]MCF6797099.1 ABC transporter permease [Bacillus sp. ET1]MCJ7985541.1 ABC transporter permease [Priestia sp. OVL9]MCJ7989757.1 ABC transp